MFYPVKRENLKVWILLARQLLGLVGAGSKLPTGQAVQ